MSPQIIIDNFIRLPDNLELGNFQLPKAKHIDEYIELQQNPKLKRLLGPVSCLPDLMGESLADKLRNIQGRSDFLMLFNDAADFFYASRHGIRKHLSAKCCECGYESIRSFRVAPSIFFGA